MAGETTELNNVGDMMSFPCVESHCMNVRSQRYIKTPLYSPIQCSACTGQISSSRYAFKPGLSCRNVYYLQIWILLSIVYLRQPRPSSEFTSKRTRRTLGFTWIRLYPSEQLVVDSCLCKYTLQLLIIIDSIQLTVLGTSFTNFIIYNA